MSKWFKMVMALGAILFSALAHGQSEKPCILITFKSGVEKTVANHSNFSFVSKDGRKYKGRIHIYNDSQFTYLTYFDELSPDTLKTDFIESVNYNEKPNHKKVHPLLLTAGIVIIPIIVIPVIIINLATKGHYNHWVNRSEFDVRIRYPDGPSSN